MQNSRLAVVGGGDGVASLPPPPAHGSEMVQLRCARSSHPKASRRRRWREGMYVRPGGQRRRCCGLDWRAARTMLWTSRRESRRLRGRRPATSRRGGACGFGSARRWSDGSMKPFPSPSLRVLVSLVTSDAYSDGPHRPSEAMAGVRPLLPRPMSLRDPSPASATIFLSSK